MVTGRRKGLDGLTADLVDHFEKRLEALDGKAMVVCMSRRICVDLYAAIQRLRPDWHADDDAGGGMKVVMTGSASDPLDWQGHIRNKPRRIRENVRANLRVVVKRILRKYGYPPDKQEKATQTVLEQAEVLSEAWTEG